MHVCHSNTHELRTETVDQSEQTTSPRLRNSVVGTVLNPLVMLPGSILHYGCCIGYAYADHTCVSNRLSKHRQCDFGLLVTAVLRDSPLIPGRVLSVPVNSILFARRLDPTALPCSPETADPLQHIAEPGLSTTAQCKTSILRVPDMH